VGKEYRYIKLIRWGQYVIPLFFGIGVILTGGPLVLLVLSDSAFSPALLPLLFLTPILVVEGVLFWYLYYRLAGISVSIGDEAIVYKHRRGKKRIPFDEITGLKFPSARYVGGWIKIISKNDTIRLTTAVENISDFLQELKASLDNRRLSDRYDRAQFFRFLKTAVYLGQSWARAYLVLWRLVVLTIFSAVIGFVLAVLGSPGSLGRVVWVSVSFLWPTVVYLATEVVFARRIAKGSDEESFTCPSRDIVYETILYDKAVRLGASLYFGTSLGVLALWLFSRY